MTEDDKRAQALQVHWRQWAVEQSVSCGVKPEDIENYANHLLCYVLGSADETDA